MCFLLIECGDQSKGEVSVLKLQHAMDMTDSKSRGYRWAINQHIAGKEGLGNMGSDTFCSLTDKH